MEPRTLLEALSVAERLKDTTRHCYTRNGRHESVAEHSWMMTLMAFFIKDVFSEVDMDKVIKMCIIHDLGEAFTGDIPTFEKTTTNEATEEELLYSWVKSLPENYAKEIFKHKDKYSVNSMCKFFEVSRSGYYAFLKRMDIPDRDLPLAEKIRECQEKTHRTYGYRRVHIWLERQGIYRNPKTVLRVMQKYNLLSVVRRKKFHYCSQHLHKYPNLLNREFTAERPNQKWVTDISYIKTAQGFLYLSIIRDLYDNSIVAYKTDKEQSIKLVLDTIKAAKRKEKITAEVQLHSDQGFQYTSHAYFNLTQSYGITPSMSRRGNPYDNALAENFFSILKTECIHRVKLSGYDEARLIISEYINFYNNYRIQTKTKLTPLEKRNQFVA